MTKFIIILLTIFVPLYIGQQILPYFRIIAPKFICPSRDDLDVLPPSQITIRMQTRSGQQLKYRVQIYFQILGSYRSQQHTLKIWRSIRTLERKIRNHTDIITKKNQININNDELTSGVLYVFNIIGIDENGLESNANNYTVTFNDGKTTTSNDGFIQNDEMSLLLIGSEGSYSDIEYIVEALVIFCIPSSDYFFEWKIINLNDANKDFLNINGKLLRIPSGILMGGNNYQIMVYVHSLNDSSIISSTGLKVKIFKKEFSASIIPTKLLTGTNSINTFKVRAQDHEGTGNKPNIIWTCKKINDSSSNCHIISNNNNMQFSVMFPSQGEYEIMALIKLNEYSKILSSAVDVQPEVLVQLNFDLPPKQPFDNHKTFYYNVEINNLIPDCFAEWKVVQEKNFEYFDSLILPNGLGNISINDVERNFLSEIIDFDNNTVSQNIYLTIPTNKKINEWNGLIGDSLYKFRLEITCPKPYNENYPDNNDNVLSYAEIIINTNKPPDGLALDITPLSGISMKTMFKFSTGIANDIELDYPLKYTFFYSFDKIVITIGEFFENMVAISELPYSHNPILTFYTVCDVRNACSKIFGPNITPELNINYTELEINYEVQLIKHAFFRMEYNYGFSVAFSCLTTLKNVAHEDSYYDVILTEIINLLKSTIAKIKNSAKTIKIYLKKNNIFQFIDLLKSFCDYFNVNDESLTENMLDVLSLIIEDGDSYEQTALKRRKKSIVTFNYLRTISHVNKKSIVNEKFIKIALSLSEKLLNSSNVTIVAHEKKKLLRKVRQYIMELCEDKDGDIHRYIDTNIVQIDVQCITSKQLKTGQFALKPNPNIPLLKVEIKFNDLNEFDKDKINDICIGRVMYPSDYLNDEHDLIFDTLIIKRFAGALPVTISINTHNDNHYPLMYIFNKKHLNINDDYICTLWKKEKWTAEYCKNYKIDIKTFRCICKTFGILKIIKMNLLQNTVSETFETELFDYKTLSTAKTHDSSTSSIEKICQENVSIRYDFSTIESFSSSNTIEPTDLNDMTKTSQLQFNTAVSEIESTLKYDFTSLSTVTSTKTANNLEVSEIFGNNKDINSTQKTNNTIGILKKESINYTTIEYSLIGLFILISLVTIIATVTYHRRKNAKKFITNFEIMTIEPRIEATNVKYGQFCDEQTLSGN